MALLCVSNLGVFIHNLTLHVSHSYSQVITILLSSYFLTRFKSLCHRKLELIFILVLIKDQVWLLCSLCIGK